MNSTNRPASDLARIQSALAAAVKSGLLSVLIFFSHLAIGGINVWNIVYCASVYDATTTLP